MNKIKEYCNILNNVFYTHTQNGVAMEEVSPSLFYLWTFEGWKWRKMGVEFLFRGGFPRGKEREIISKEIPRERERERERGIFGIFVHEFPRGGGALFIGIGRCFGNISPLAAPCNGLLGWDVSETSHQSCPFAPLISIFSFFLFSTLFFGLLFGDL